MGDVEKFPIEHIVFSSASEKTERFYKDIFALCEFYGITVQDIIYLLQTRDGFNCDRGNES